MRIQTKSHPTVDNIRSRQTRSLQQTVTQTCRSGNCAVKAFSSLCLRQSCLQRRRWTRALTCRRLSHRRRRRWHPHPHPHKHTWTGSQRRRTKLLKLTMAQESGDMSALNLLMNDSVLSGLHVRGHDGVVCGRVTQHRRKRLQTRHADPAKLLGE